MKTWSMAFRNILRAKRRSLITILAMAFALGIMVVYTGLMDGMIGDMKKNAVMLEMGHVQIHAEGYQESPSIYKRIQTPDVLLERLAKAGYTASYRLFASGLAAHGNSSAGVYLRGVAPDLEAETMRLPHHLLAGKWLNRNDPKDIVLGKRLAKTLSASLGDEIVIVSQASDGSIANDLYRVGGILKSISEEVDRAGLFMTVDAFRYLMVVAKGAHEIVITLPEDADLNAAASTIANMAQEIEVSTWRQLNPALAQMIDAADAFLLPLVIITYIAVAIVILNAMLMAVFERIREYGVMKALGVNPYEVFFLVLTETIIMTTAAAVLGLGFGVPLAFYLETHGINLTPFTEGTTISGVALDLIWHSMVSARTILLPLVTLYVLTVIATIYPAAKAAYLNPVEAIHHH